MTFGEWLRRQIEDRTLTQERFAQQGGFSTSTLKYWLNNTPDIRGRNIVKLARALGLPREQVERQLKRGRRRRAAAA